MTIILIIFCIWGASALVRASKEAKRQEAERKRSAELKRMTAEWRAQKAEAEAQARKQAELEREQMRQAREQEKLAKEQEKQAAQLAKHEERLLRLEQKLELAQRDEEHQGEIVSAIRVEIAGIEGYIAYCKSKGLLCKGKEDELRKLNDKLYREETKLIKARQARELCEKQMEVA